MAVCFPLSWKLLIYALETLFVASDSTPTEWRLVSINNSDSGQRTGKSPFSASRETSVERAGTSVDPTQSITILRPQFSVIRPQRVGLYPFPANKEEVLLQGCARQYVLDKVRAIQTATQMKRIKPRTRDGRQEMRTNPDNWSGRPLFAR
jgi:hypothetical protein